MGSKAKIRLTVTVDGQPRELFAVRQTNKDDLIVLIRASDEMDFGPHHASLLEHRFTVHPSPQSDGFTITQRIKFEDGAEADTYSHIKPVGGRLIWPVLANVTPDLSRAKYIATPKAADKTISVGSYDPTYASACYVLLVSDRQTNLRHILAPLPLQVFAVRYRTFIAWMLVGFINAPSSHLGNLVTISTASPRFRGANVIKNFPQAQIAHGLSLGEVIPEIHRMLDQLSAKFEDRVATWWASEGSTDPEQRSGLAALSRLYSKAPLYKDK